jgi:hypothetical protein
MNERIGCTNEISAYVHCAFCLAEWVELPSGSGSMADYARFELGFTDVGFQVFCRRHRMNVLNIDFDGHKLPVRVDAELPGGRALPTYVPEDVT